MSLELVLVTPVLLLLLMLVVLGGRYAQARADVDAAARDAARAASNARAVFGAEVAGRDAARSSLREGGVTCRRLDVVVDAAAFVPGGLVTATVSCTVDLGDLAGLRVPGSRLFSSTFSEPVDVYRGTS
jgi:hypothetical protein